MENEYVSWRLILRKIAGENLSEAEERQLQDWMKVDVRRREYVENAWKDWRGRKYTRFTSVDGSL